MITGILGMLNEPRQVDILRASPCGNGKTNTLTYLLWMEHVQKDRKVITNYHTRYSGGNFGDNSWSQYMTSQEIFDHWFDDENYGAVIGITELQSLLNSAARNAKLIKYIELCLQQRRKRGYDIIWDSQRWMSGDLRIRDNTDFLYRPEKWHTVYSPEAGNWLPTERCPNDICDEKHLILVYQEVPRPLTIEEMLKPRLILKSWEIGQLYDTKECMRDVLQYNPGWEKNVHL